MSDWFKDYGTSDNRYPGTYSLWGNSSYYDINNLSPQSYFANLNNGGFEMNSSNSTSQPKKKAPPLRDSLNRRIVSRESLYENPASQNREFMALTQMPSDPFPIGISQSPKNQIDFDWTEFYWHKATEKLGEQEWGQSTGIHRVPFGPAKIPKKFNKLLLNPVTFKSESIMPNFGWQGAASGPVGGGFMNSLSPNPVYGSTTIGEMWGPQIPSKKFEIFDKNFLKQVLKFVKNNFERELVFDSALTKDERRRIHHLIQVLVMGDDVMKLDFESNYQMEMLFQIEANNSYYLLTESSGKECRQLRLRKVAPSYVYLIIPDNLKLKKGEVKHLVQDLSPRPEDTYEEESNPFLRSITRNLPKVKPECPPVPVLVQPEKLAISTKIVEYFIDFASNSNFTEFKFMGPFSNEEFDAINEFLNQAVRYFGKQGDCSLVSIFGLNKFAVQLDRSGNTVITKTV